MISSIRSTLFYSASMPFLSGLFMHLALSNSALTADDWTDLFNGKNLDGWVQRGGKATYTVEDGSIVGTSMQNTPNTFLCTIRDYGDFIFEYEFKVDPRLNSGVQIRSQCLTKPGSVVWNGKTINLPAGKVHGYQVEIDPEQKLDRWWTAGIYDESRRGWLFPGELGGAPKAFTEQGRAIFKPEDWNKVRVEASGGSIKTYLNGEPRAAINDTLTLSGFIALQVHSIGGEAEKAGTQVRWRNLRIQEVPTPVKP
jgi:hypothetical protein